MIVVTGGLGFIGSNLIKKLNDTGQLDVISLDIKNDNLANILYWLYNYAKKIDFIIHFGAITDTTLDDDKRFKMYNLFSSIYIWNLCVENKIPLIYASSAATYGDGEFGFDDEEPIFKLNPLNLYGWSKQNFDLYVMKQKKYPPFWYGLKFFNVYGYGEEHKGNMSSFILQAYKQIKKNNIVKLFKSYRDDILDGEQKRDFIYINDLINVCLFFINNTPPNGIYNVGTGISRTYNDVVKAIFNTLNLNVNIKYIDMPQNIINKYQYYTEAKINKLRKIGYYNNFYSIEQGIFEYINQLENENC